jgi:hypothetical protein
VFALQHRQTAASGLLNSLKKLLVPHGRQEQEQPAAGENCRRDFTMLSRRDCCGTGIVVCLRKAFMATNLTGIISRV